MFFAVSLANLLLPTGVAHVAQIGLLAISVLIQPLFIFFFNLDTGLQRFVFVVGRLIFKLIDHHFILDLFFRAHVILTNNNIYYWMLNYFHFGILGSWPILRYVNGT